MEDDVAGGGDRLTVDRRDRELEMDSLGLRRGRLELFRGNIVGSRVALVRGAIAPDRREQGEVAGEGLPGQSLRNSQISRSRPEAGAFALNHSEGIPLLLA